MQDPKNPILLFRAKHPRVSWSDMVAQTGLCKMTLFNISRKDAEGLVRVDMKTHLSLKEAFGIDLAKYLEDYFGIK